MNVSKFAVVDAITNTIAKIIWKMLQIDATAYLVIGSLRSANAKTPIDTPNIPPAMTRIVSEGTDVME